MTATPDTTVKALHPTMAHYVNLANAFTSVALDAAILGLKPCSIEVNDYGTTSRIEVGVYFKNADTASVDALADHYGLPADEDGPNYRRQGNVQTADGDHLFVKAYSARPTGGAL